MASWSSWTAVLEEEESARVAILSLYVESGRGDGHGMRGRAVDSSVERETERAQATDRDTVTLLNSQTPISDTTHVATNNY